MAAVLMQRDVQALLPSFLDEMERRPFRYGECDCLLALADWVAWVGWTDPAAHLRRTYHGERGWRRVVRDAGGIKRLVADLARAAGLEERRGDPLSGDIGLVLLDSVRIRGAIWCGDGRAAVKCRDGLATLRWPPAAPAWGWPWR
jgi:hypothetical protein